MPWYRRKTTYLLFIIWAHITLLDLFYVGHYGPVFLWEQNLRISTALVHIGIAFSTWLFYLLFVKLRTNYQLGRFKLSEKIWIVCSACMILSIGFLLF